MNAPPFPLNPQIGDWWQNWVWNGARWVSSPTTGLRVLTQTFSASGPYMPSPGLVSLVAECVGGGGGGGGVSGNATYIMGGGGGGSGGRSIKTLPAALVRGGVLVTVGTGGGQGDAGGSTSFGALCTANGGGGAQGNDGSTLWGRHGDGALAGIGDVAFPGATGENGRFFAPAGPAMLAGGGAGGQILGGNSDNDTPAGSTYPGIAGVDGTGAGGSGACANQSTDTSNNTLGGNGGSGICIVTEYCWGDRDQPNIGWSPPTNVNLNVRQVPPGPWPPGQPGPWWPPGWPPGWGPGQPWPPGWGPRPPWVQPFEGQAIEGQTFEGREFDAGGELQPYDPTGQDGS